MKYLIKTQEQLKDYMVKLNSYNLKEPITIEIEKLYKNKTNQQLRAFWMLIRVVKLWMNEQGNNFTDEEVKNYFLIKSGHYQEINNVKIAKSISNTSDTTKEIMKNIINNILEFGITYNIKDCYIDSYDLEGLLNNYKE